MHLVFSSFKADIK